MSYVSNISETIPFLELSEVKVGMGGSLKLLDIASSDNDRREGRGVANPTVGSVQQGVDDVSPGITQTFPPIKYS